MENNITFILNNQIIRTDLNPATVLLDFIRKDKKLTGTKEVCKEGDCGACSVLLGDVIEGNLQYKTINSCLYPIQKVNGKHIVTIEGLNQNELNPIQESFANEGASQCGFCTPGFIVSSTAYLLNTDKFDNKDAVNTIAGNICRCTGYQSIKRALTKVVDKDEKINFDLLVEKGIIPSYFKEILEKIKSISDQTKTSKGDVQNNIQLISGGTDLFVQKPDELLNKTFQIIENIIPPSISIIRDKVVISGSATVADLQKFIQSQNINLKLDNLFKLFASLPIRNSATLAGNIVNASPIADLAITLLALNSELTLLNSKNEQRSIVLNKFYSGYKILNKANDEIISEISFDLPKTNSLFNFEKVSKRTHLDIASVNTAINLNVEQDKIIEASISTGGVSPIPLFLEKTSEFLKNSNISNTTIVEAVKIALTEISPISDIRGSIDYKTLLLSQLIKAHFIELFPKLITPEVFE
ncbi:MAG: (2Fe-2S)-binding protein [Ignavibacteriae bacterium]|nr:(2Fe-2S)-binding protein [Ignavibacteriota bacterium]